MNKSLFVGNLPHTTTESELKVAFAPHGAVISVTIVRDRETGEPRGFAFIEMDEQGAEIAKRELDGTEFGGRPLRVNDAQQRETRGTRGRGGARSGRGGHRGGDGHGGRGGGPPTGRGRAGDTRGFGGPGGHKGGSRDRG